MNTKPDATKLLCYGDSNTWGQKPDKTGRFPINVRWTGRLQASLGDDYYVIEEGLSSRTTNLEYSRPGRNGKTYLQPCLESHFPLDIVLLMLGTNDFKIEFGRSAQEVAAANAELIALITEISMDKQKAKPAIILVSPIHIVDTAPRFDEFYTGVYDHNSAVKSIELAGDMKEVAHKYGCQYLDASTVAIPGEDGIHFSETAHKGLAEALTKLVDSLK